MSYLIRKARQSDSEPIAGLMLMAMEEIVYAFLNRRDHQKALLFMRRLVEQEGNQYSYQHTWVAEEEGQVVGSITCYKGSELHALREPVLELLATGYGRVVHPEDETEAGEYYVDTIAVHPSHRGKGLGTGLLRFVINRIVKQAGQTVGLLVDVDNPKAKNLYLQLGFVKVGDRQLMQHPYEHLQISP
ncbi:MAG TPA: GNAT family N-acetyltransferase [Cyclobacteriaceae bacterium]|nr:GNAT family N-acetyltransferase [Cyclobacteriaceae bacterium]